MTDDALRAAAIAATPGPWSAAVAHSQVSVITSTRRQLVCHGSGLHARQNCAYIAAASPDVVLALLERVRVAEAAAHDATATGHQSQVPDSCTADRPGLFGRRLGWTTDSHGRLARTGASAQSKEATEGHGAASPTTSRREPRKVGMAMTKAIGRFKEPPPRTTPDHEFTESKFGNNGVVFCWRKWRELTDFLGDDLSPWRFPVEMHVTFWESDLPLGPMMIEQSMGINMLGRRLKAVISPGDGQYVLFTLQALSRDPDRELHEFGTASSALLPAPLDTDPNGFRKDPYGD